MAVIQQSGDGVVKPFAALHRRPAWRVGDAVLRASRGVFDIKRHSNGRVLDVAVVKGRTNDGSKRFFFILGDNGLERGATKGGTGGASRLTEEIRSAQRTRTL
ncbi:hypothetical protein ABH945_002148 [Paraburkholderia sp. GAS333]|uniref:hypothetical protein n=1 Tax=Paraburkholderia sp. GAS333 TaxID=3156279 RepID=UPI003D208042